jgi:indolepyruvate ferredoxin oxidoreductase beta subunit
MGLLVTGVGGQGVVLASDIIAEAAMASGYDVKKTDTLGMAQRGGSVVSHVRIGSKVRSPLLGEGTADVLLAFEKLEAARWVNYLRPGAAVIVNQQAQPPLSVNLGYERYPTDEEVSRILSVRTDRIYYVEGVDRARKAGDARSLNTFMLGCASCFMPLEVRVWKETISQRVPERVREINMAAFDAGREEMKDVCLQ